MRSIGLAWCLVCASVPFASAQEAKRETEKAAPPFWLLPKTDLDLRSLAPAPVQLVAGPDRTRPFALLQIGDQVPSADYGASNQQEDTGYRVVPGGLKVGAGPYGDRRIKIEKLPAGFSGLTLLQTKMGHKFVLDGRFSVVVSTAEPCLVFVALDERALETYKEHGVPAWLQEFTPTGHKLATDDFFMARDNSSYRLFVKKAPAGRIVFGPPCMGEVMAMYFAFFATAK
jgi:hypothetical protein